MNSELLSRIAETLYWTGRYVERADDTARLFPRSVVHASEAIAKRYFQYQAPVAWERGG